MTKSLSHCQPNTLGGSNPCFFAGAPPLQRILSREPWPEDLVLGGFLQMVLILSRTLLHAIVFTKSPESPCPGDCTVFPSASPKIN